MVEQRNPIEIPPAYGNAITKAVKRFSSDKDLEVILWYHDEPVWFVKKQQEDLVRRVQISAFHVKEDDQLIPVIKLIPDAYRVKESRVVKHVEQARIKDLIQTVLLTGTSVEKIQDEVYWSLDKAWAWASLALSKLR